MIEGLT